MVDRTSPSSRESRTGRDTLSNPVSHSVLPRASSHSPPPARPATVDSKSEIDGAATRERLSSPAVENAPSHPADVPSAECLANEHELVDVLTGPGLPNPVDVVDAATVDPGPEPPVEVETVPDPFHPRSCADTCAAFGYRQTSLRNRGL